MTDDLVKRYRQLQEVIGGCHDGYCVVRKPKGMHTNGGCTCLEDLRLHERSRIGHLLRCAQEMADRIEELEAKLEKAVRLISEKPILATYEDDVQWQNYVIAELTGGNDD